MVFFYSIVNRIFCKQIVETLSSGSAASGLGLHYLPTSHKNGNLLRVRLAP